MIISRIMKDDLLDQTTLEKVKEIVLIYVCPSIGVIIANLLFFAPVHSLRSSLKKGFIGDLNPVPWGFMIGNCAGWLGYSYLTLDLFLFFANAPGFLLSLWLNFGAIKLQYIDNYEESASAYIDDWENDENGSSRSFLDEPLDLPDMGKQKHLPSLTKHEIIAISVSTFWLLVFTLVAFIPFLSDRKEFIIGVIVNLNLVIFYGAPLSTIYTVITEKNSSSIHVRLMITSLLNSIFWTVYGLAILDIFIIVPNSMGCLFGAIQVLLLKLYPKQLNISVALRRATIMRATLQYHGASPEKRKTILEQISPEKSGSIDSHSSPPRRKAIRFQD